VRLRGPKFLLISLLFFATTTAPYCDVTGGHSAHASEAGLKFRPM
jgi:hypothetical protein